MLAWGAGTLSAARRDVVGSDATQLAREVYRVYGQAALQETFVGSETCLACHSGPRAVHNYDASGWRNTLHSHPFKTVEDDRDSMVMGKGVVADSNGNGIDDFREGLDLATTPAFAKYGENAPKLGYDENGYFVIIGEVRLPVFFAWGATPSATASSVTPPAFL